MIINHFRPPCRVFLVHIGKEAIFLSPQTTQLGTITQIAQATSRLSVPDSFVPNP
jgi:hypothetical protein